MALCTRSSVACLCCPLLADVTALLLASLPFPPLRGGGIELAILADFWDIEIAALDVESCHQYVFGQSEDASQQKSKRIYLVYYVRLPRKRARSRACELCRALCACPCCAGNGSDVAS